MSSPLLVAKSLDVTLERSCSHAGSLADAVRSKTSIHFGLYFSQFEWFNRLYLEDKARKFATQTYVEVCGLRGEGRGGRGGGGGG